MLLVHAVPALCLLRVLRDVVVDRSAFDIILIVRGRAQISRWYLAILIQKIGSVFRVRYDTSTFFCYLFALELDLSLLPTGIGRANKWVLTVYCTRRDNREGGYRQSATHSRFERHATRA
mmetsp:Transcript_11528/g.25841  ORF Transcript_11528/g.25841 Transcript_11528/m.25841 type:complete len:120 (+) Transcript_11528:818-1177(+)